MGNQRRSDDYQPHLVWPGSSLHSHLAVQSPSTVCLFCTVASRCKLSLPYVSLYSRLAVQIPSTVCFFVQYSYLVVQTSSTVCFPVQLPCSTDFLYPEDASVSYETFLFSGLLPGTHQMIEPFYSSPSKRERARERETDPRMPQNGS